MSAVLTFSFRWRFELPDQGVTFDSYGRPHTGVFVHNAGTDVARDVKFRGTMQLLAGHPSAEEVEALREALPWAAARPCAPNLSLPLFYPLQGTEQVGGSPATLYAFGEVEYQDQFTAHPRSSTFCVYWTGGSWDVAPVGNHVA